MLIERDESLQPFNTLALQSRARALVNTSSQGELEQALRWAAQRDLPVMPLGDGSNVVLAGDIDALVVRQSNRGMDIIQDSGEQLLLRVAAGEDWHQLVQWSVQQDLCGLENLALIPGTVGAAPIQNIGAYGVELQSCVVAVHATEVATGEILQLSRQECGFAYRDSVFKGELRDKLVITAVDLALSRGKKLNTDYPALAAFFADSGKPARTAQDVCDAVVSIRRSKLPDPAVDPNAGSFFTNPLVSAEQAESLAEKFPGMPMFPQSDGRVKLAAGWLIDFCGWKGYRENGLGVHPNHALVIVNYGNNKGQDLLSLASEIAVTVADTFGLQLHIEPRVYG